MESPLALKEYFFPVSQVVAEPGFPSDADVNDLDYSIDVSLAVSENKEKYQLSVEIYTTEEEENDEGKPRSYRVHLVAVGVFEVSPKWEEPEKLVRINGASILYSAAREFLITITSRGPWGAITLPTVSFNKSLKKDHEEKEEQNPEET